MPVLQICSRGGGLLRGMKGFAPRVVGGFALGGAFSPRVGGFSPKMGVTLQSMTPLLYCNHPEGNHLALLGCMHLLLAEGTSPTSARRPRATIKGLLPPL